MYVPARGVTYAPVRCDVFQKRDKVPLAGNADTET